MKLAHTITTLISIITLSCGGEGTPAPRAAPRASALAAPLGTEAPGADEAGRAFDHRELAAALLRRAPEGNAVVAPGSALGSLLVATEMSEDAAASPLGRMVEDREGAWAALRAWPRRETESAQTRLDVAAFVDAARVSPSLAPRLVESGVEVVDAPWRGDTEQAMARMNQWRAERDLPPSPIAPDADTLGVTLSRFGLDTDWFYSFPEADTEVRPFHTESGAEIAVPTMCRLSTPAAYGEGPRARYVALPLGVSIEDEWETEGPFDAFTELAFIAVLPNPGVHLAEVEAQLDGAELLRWTRDLEVQQVGITLPRFAFRSAIDLLHGVVQDRGSGVGVAAANTETNVDVNEYGVRAVGTTMMLVTVRDEPPMVVLDRPFLFMVYDHRHEVVLLLGRVTDPRAS